MKPLLPAATLFAVLSLAGCATLQQPAPAAPSGKPAAASPAAAPEKPLAAPAATGWELVAADEFDRDGAPDEKKWSYEKGFVRNEEPQFYTDSQKNVRVENGCLVIEARRETVPNPKYREGSEPWQTARKEADYTSASLTTRGKKAWLYGRIEMRAKLTAGKGTWPAFWTLGASGKYPACGEIDIMEYLARQPTTVYGTIHYPAPDPSQKRTSQSKQWKTPKAPDTPANDFHIYAIEWDEREIRWFYDDHCFHVFNIDEAGTGADNPFRKPQYLILNLALGKWGGPIDDNALPQQFLVDYVRVYRQKP